MPVFFIKLCIKWREKGMAETKRRIIDKRIKEKFMMDDAYLNGQARLCGWQGTIVYLSLCRHSDKEQRSFPSINLMATEHRVSRPTILKGIENLVRRNVINVKKTRTKNGQWLNNLYILTDKSEWDYSPIQVNHVDKDVVNHVDTVQVNENTPPSQRRLLDVVNHVDTKETHSEGNTYKETHSFCKTAFCGNEINDLIKLFEPVNPHYDTLFYNKTERSALEYLVKKHGMEAVVESIKVLPKIVFKKYAPRITRPTELKRDLGKLIIQIEQEKEAFNKRKIIEV